MNITGKAKVWVNEVTGANGTFNTYALSIGSKRQDGSWANASQKVRFKNDIPKPNHGDYINITNAFASVDEWEDKTSGKTRSQVVWVITEYEISDSANKSNTGSNFGSQRHTDGTQVTGFSALIDEDVPF